MRYLASFLLPALCALSMAACRSGAAGERSQYDRPPENAALLRPGTISESDAARMVAAFFHAHGTGFTGFDSEGRSWVDDGRTEILFHYRDGRITTGALIYRFREEPRTGVLQAFANEHRSGTPAGGGRLTYEKDTRKLSLMVHHDNVLPDAGFVAAIDSLAAAGHYWGTVVLDRVASKVFHPEELEGGKR